MSGINRHKHIVKDSEGEFIAERVFHQGQIKTQPHRVLMAFAMICAGREEPATVEIHVKAKEPLINSPILR